MPADQTMTSGSEGKDPHSPDSESDLVPVLASFLEDPTNNTARDRWYAVLADAAPLWAFRGTAFAEHGGGPSVMSPPGNWHLMVLPSLHLSGDGLEHARDRLLTIANPGAEGTALFWGSRISKYQHEDAVLEAAAWYRELAWMIAFRDLASNQNERDRYQYLMDQYTKKMGLTARKGRRSLPNAKAFVKQLAGECVRWLDAERAARTTALKTRAQKALAWTGRDEEGLRRYAVDLAFPFLQDFELSYVRRVPDDWRPRLAAIHLIHYRVRAFLDALTVARYAWGTRFIDTLGDDDLTANPLLSLTPTLPPA